MSLKHLNTIEQVQMIKKDWDSISIGFVPTMGALHAGHLELVRNSMQENDKTIVSIFVNPTQFNNSDDLKDYPDTLNSDIEKLEAVGVDYLFLPEYDELYSDNYRYKISENQFANILEGEKRPGHFDGVLTVVMKMLNLISPDRAYFGLKDYQQYHLVKDMAEAFFLKTKVIGIDTVREEDGLAMSSRNLRLSEEAREKAPSIYKAITEMNDLNQAKQFILDKGFDLEYLEELEGRRFIAANIEGIRLIDNVEK